MKLNLMRALAGALVLMLCISCDASACDYVRVTGRGAGYVEVVLPMRLMEEQMHLKVRQSRTGGEDEWYVYRTSPIEGSRSVDGVKYSWKLAFRNGTAADDFAPCVLAGAVSVGESPHPFSRIIELTPFQKKGARIALQVQNLSVALENTDTSDAVPGDLQKPAPPPEEYPPLPEDQGGSSTEPAKPPETAAPAAPSEKIIYLSLRIRITFMDKYEPAIRLSPDGRCPWCGFPWNSH